MNWPCHVHDGVRYCRDADASSVGMVLTFVVLIVLGWFVPAFLLIDRGRFGLGYAWLAGFALLITTSIWAFG